MKSKTKLLAIHLTPAQNLLKVLVGKRSLIIENDLELHYGMDKMEDFLRIHKLEYFCLLDLKNVELEKIKKYIQQFDVIIFQTQWVHEISHDIKSFAFEMREKKIFIECYINEPTWYYKPKVRHNVYILRTLFDPWKFYKLSSKPYWDYKNKFDK